MSDRPNIIVFNQTSKQSQELKQGFMDYVEQNALPWRTLLLDEGMIGQLPDGQLSSQFHVDAMVGFIPSRPLVEAALRQGAVIATPRRMLQVQQKYPDAPMALVSVDETAVARVAAEHIREQGFRHAAIIGSQRGVVELVDQRFALFAEACEQVGISCASYRPVRGPELSREEQDEKLVKWLRTQRFPMAAFLHQDRAAVWFSQLCRINDFKIPDEVAILSVDNDATICEVCDPPLSSVIIPWRWIGKELGLRLHRVFAGERLVEESVARPCAVYRRASTDLAPLLDPLIARTRQLLSRRVKPPTVADLARHLGISRRQLHTRFTDALGYGPKQFLHSECMLRAAELIQSTEQAITDIATRLGFQSYSSFSAAFKAHAGVCPRLFRQQG